MAVKPTISERFAAYVERQIASQISQINQQCGELGKSPAEVNEAFLLFSEISLTWDDL
jgi:hypothetical protein